MINGIQFINGRRWVDTYYNGRMVAGSQIVDVSGEIISVAKTYNDNAYIKIFGKTVEIGEGDKSPDNPYELKSVGDDGGFDLVSCGKNIADIKTLDSFKNGIFWYDTARTVSLTISGSTIHYDYDTSDLSNFIRAKITNLQANAQYTVSCKISPFTGVIRSLFGILNVSYNSLVNGVFKTTFTTDGNGEHLMGYGAGTDGMILHIQKTHTNPSVNITSSVTISDIQIELGSTATPYTPFRGMQTVHIPYTLRSLPDGTADYILIDNVQKRAWWQSLTEKNILNSSSGFIYRADLGNTDGYSRFQKTIQQPVSGVGRCSHFNMLSSITSSNEGYIFSATYSYVGLVLSNSRLEVPVGVSSGDALSSLNDWLSVNPVTAACKLANPPEPIELDYNAVKTYYPFAQIYTTSAVQPTFEGKIRVWEVT